MKRALIWLMIGLPILAIAHSGRLNRHSCHHDRKRGEYHCHGNASNGRSNNAITASRTVNNAYGTTNSNINANSNNSQRHADTSTIIGIATVIDGDTIEIHGQRIRLHGIDAHESQQLCKNSDGQSYRCGQQAAMALAGLRGVKSNGTETYVKAIHPAPMVASTV